jgi:hypothetical protein
MSEIIVIESQGSVHAYVPAVAGDTTIVRASDKIQPQKTVEIKSRFDIHVDKDIAPWGDENMWPTRMLKKAQNSGLFSRNTMTIAAVMYGQGLECYKSVMNGSKEERYPVDNEEILEFIEQSELNYWFMEQCNDMATFLNCFSTLHMPVGSTTFKSKKITKIGNLEAEYCRVSMTEKGISKTLFYSPGFADDGKFEEANGAKYKLAISRNADEMLSILGPEKVFAYRKKFPLAAGFYYGIPPWACLMLDDSWIDVAITTPKILNSMNRNMTVIKFHIEYTMDYWKFIYSDWDKKSEQAKRTLIDEEITRMNKFLSGVENAGKTYVTFKAIDPVTKKELPGCTITPLKSNWEKDAYLPNNTAANAEICYYQGIDPSTVGLEKPGGKLGAGSGSDKRVSWNTMNLMMKPLEDTLLSSIRYVHRFNDWPKEYKWAVKRDAVVTLDNNKETNELQ